MRLLFVIDRNALACSKASGSDRVAVLPLSQSTRQSILLSVSVMLVDVYLEGRANHQG